MKENQKRNVEIFSEAGNSFVLASIDAGYGYQKVTYQDAQKGLDKEPKNMTLPSMVRYGTKTEGDGEFIFINDVPCVINSGKKVGQLVTEGSVSTKVSEHMRANIYYTLYQLYKETGKKNFRIALGTTTDIATNERRAERYREFMMGNMHTLGLEKQKRNGKIKIEDKGNVVELSIDFMMIVPEGTASVFVTPGVNRTGRFFMVDIGSLTDQIIRFDSGCPNYEKSLYSNGYVPFIEGMREDIQDFSTQGTLDYNDTEKEFKLRKGSKYKKYIDDYIVNVYLDKVLMNDFKSAGVDIVNDQIGFTGGTVEELQDYIKEYFEKKHKKEVLFATKPLYANSEGMFKLLKKQIADIKRTNKMNKAKEAEKAKTKEEQANGGER